MVDNNLDFGAIETLIKTSTQRTLNAFKDLAANVDKVTLEFGVTVSGSVGVPYITQGEVGSNFKIKVECSFPERK
ncbi:MAG: CU044_2847 family protein [Cyanobacteria bacterium P01_G01_bin.54]